MILFITLVLLAAFAVLVALACLVTMRDGGFSQEERPTVMTAVLAWLVITAVVHILSALAVWENMR